MSRKCKCSNTPTMDGSDAWFFGVCVDGAGAGCVCVYAKGLLCNGLQTGFGDGAGTC